MPGKRRPVHKTFTGCARCKASKVKCDEGKPSCARCTARKLPCPGYPAAAIRWSTKHEVYNVSAEKSLATQSRRPLSAPIENAPDSELPSQDVYESSVTVIPTAWGHLDPHIKDDLQLGTLCRDDDHFMAANAFNQESEPLDSIRPARDFIILQQLSIPPQIDSQSTMLVSYYFQDVCAVFSSFDSDSNPFRSYVSRVFAYSGPVFNAMMSSSAARLAEKMPSLKVVALQYQSQAFRCVAESLSQGKKVPEATLFAIFLLGLSTAWHDGKDIGLAHFRAAKRVITKNLISSQGSHPAMPYFFEAALAYWEMALTLVSDEVELSFDLDKALAKKSHKLEADGAESGAEAEGGTLRIVPHPWTGISSRVQTIFCHVTGLIRSLKIWESDPDTVTSMSRYGKLAEDAAKLDLALWSLRLPKVSEIDDSRDPNTPASHHVLMAKAYTLASLYQLYYKFPSVMQRRREDASPAMWPMPCPETSPVPEWYASLPEQASSDEILHTLGYRVLACLQQIPITSGTRSVQAILILVASGSLRMPQSSPPDVNSGLALQKYECETVTSLRAFSVSRLSALRLLIHSRPVDLMLKVVGEMYRRLDSGQEAFLNDVVHEMGCETMLG